MRGVEVTAATATRVPVGAGRLQVWLVDSYVDAEWVFDVPAPSALRIDFLDPALCSVDGADTITQRIPDGFVPPPRVRLRVGDAVHEVVCTDARVLARHYSRRDHQAIAYAGRPDRWVEAYHRARVRQAARLLRGVAGVVCDVASGHSLVVMAGPWPFRLVALDRDAGATRSLSARGVRAVVASADAPPFADGAFDAVYAGEVVEHLADPHEALRRWVRLLRPGGRLVVTTPNRRHLLTRARRFEVVENPEHLFEWDLGELVRAVGAAGAAVDTVEGLALPLPVWVPGRGWRDLSAAVLRRLPAPPAVAVRLVEAGRRAPALAADLAVVAHRVR